MTTRRTLLKASAAAATLPLPAFTFAAAWPDKPLSIIVPFPPGGTSDVIARLISTPLGEMLKTTVVVENKTGANGAVGAAAVAQSSNEHTMLLSDMSSLAINAVMEKALPYKPSQLAGATLLAYSPHLLCTHPSNPANNVKELAERSKQKPINIASSGIGSANHLGAVEIALASGMKFVHVPFRGGAQSIEALAHGAAARRADDRRARRQGLRIRHLPGHRDSERDEQGQCREARRGADCRDPHSRDPRQARCCGRRGDDLEPQGDQRVLDG
jgi:tripartite-type tricarboxylate transporter receptor subunit TctC